MNNLVTIGELLGTLAGNAAGNEPAEGGAMLPVDTHWLAALQAKMTPPAAVTPTLPHAPTLSAPAQPVVDQLPEEWLKQVLEQLERRAPRAPELPQEPREGLATFINASLPATPVTVAPSTPVMATPLPSPLQPGFADAFVERVHWMAGKGVSEARIEINPREFGPISIRITSQADGVQVQLDAAHAQTRHALTAALPRLGEMFAASGMVLREARVLEEGERLEETAEDAALRPGLLRRQA